MKTKILTILISLLTSHGAFSADIQEYDCEATLPSGTARMTVDLSKKSHQIQILFQADGVQNSYPGRFDITWENKQKNRSFFAQGAFVDGHEVIPTSIQGHLEPNEFGFVFLSLNARWDHRIEYGYGNPLQCTLL